jgi:hypothetical protein
VLTSRRVAWRSRRAPGRRRRATERKGRTQSLRGRSSRRRPELRGPGRQSTAERWFPFEPSIQRDQELARDLSSGS